MSRSTKQRRPTLAAGATIQRVLVRRYVARLRHRFQADPDPESGDFNLGVIYACRELDLWLYAEPKRATKGKPGVGR